MLLSPLPVSFYSRPALQVARDLLGARLVRITEAGERLTGFIVETEAYLGESDLACHARAGRTARTEVMYGPPGRAYVYFIYGIHWMLNCVAEPLHSPAAILIRALLPGENLPLKATDGPAKLCKTFGIDGRFNGVDLTQPESGLWIEPGQAIAEANIIRSPRVGIENVPEPWRSQPWRLRVMLENGQLPASGTGQ